ncbi:MAG: hypothetical protein ABIN48_15470 [Ginsengibacter sp.]
MDKVLFIESSDMGDIVRKHNGNYFNVIYLVSFGVIVSDKIFKY